MTYLSKMANLTNVVILFHQYYLFYYITLVLYTIKNKSVYVVRNSIFLNLVRCFGDTFTSALMFSERNLSQFNRGPLTFIEPRTRIAHHVLQLYRMFTQSDEKCSRSVGSSTCDRRAKFSVKLVAICSENYNYVYVHILP